MSSVEIEQDRAFLNGRGVDLRSYKRVRLQTPRMLPASIAKTLQARAGNDQLVCVPQDIEQGWFCACGAFHPNEENTQVCSECGGDRAFIKAALTRVLEEARQAAEQQQREINEVANGPADPAAATAAAAQAAIEQQEATAQFDPKAEQDNPELARVRRYASRGGILDDDEDNDESTRMFDTEEQSGELDYDDEDEDDDDYAPRRRGRYADDSEESPDDVMAERIIHWAPPITAVICALIVAFAVIYRLLIA